MHLLTLLPRFRRAYAELDVLAARERWSRADIESLQLERLNAVWGHAVAHVPHYRDQAAVLDLPPRFQSLDEFRAHVPILAKDTVRHARHTLLSERPGPGTWRLTGGSTGTVTRVYSEHAAHRETQRCKYRHAAMFGVDIFDRCTYVWGHGASFAPGWRGRLARLQQPIEDRLRNRMRLSAYDLSSEALRRHLRRMAAWRPRSLYAYTTAAYMLAREGLHENLSWDELAYVMVTAEPTTPQIVRTIERAFGVPAIREYGSIECGALAAEWPDRTLRVREDVCLLETVPRDDGRFDIVVTVLRNPSFPLLRYAIADVTDRKLTRPDRGFASLSGVAGRDNDILVSRTGRALNGFWFDDLFEHLPGTRRWRVHQHADGAVTTTVEMEPGAEPPDTGALAARIVGYLDGYPVTVEVVHRIGLNRAGKHRWVESDLAAELGRSMKRNDDDRMLA